MDSTQQQQYVLFPIQNIDCWKAYKLQMSCFWTAEEIDLSHDKFEELKEPEKQFILQILAFFSSSDLLVNENLVSNFVLDAPCVEAQFFYRFQAMMEDVHSETYSLLIDTYVKDTRKKHELFHAFETKPSIRNKALFMKKYMDPKLPYSTRLVAWACVEGIMFSSSFCAVFWFKKRGMLPGLTFSNELISRDEGMHCDFACLLFKQQPDKPDRYIVLDIVEEACELEKQFVRKALKCNLIGMNASSMTQYVEFCADRLLLALGMEKKWHANNPFDWMTLISLDGKTNFFEKRVGEYSKAGVGDDGEGGGNHFFSMNEDF